ncbi:hypothetical protein Caci_4252 [Catenulispora acidiphila DSM 44928]|uniref:Uncharacterized protein n=2 Tax=Catenulispora TaxID=414878 RepID=C7QI71_CATAD|nr:hypothetical protein Caci_4252 [Catenulispora acidiphila DSM 44928]
MTTQPGGAPAPLPPLAVSVFVLAGPGLGPAGTSKTVFQQLVQMTSEIQPAQPATTPPPTGTTSGVTHTRAPLGTALPPTVTLKRRLDADTSPWQWHRAASLGLAEAIKDVALEMYTAPDYAAGKPPAATWQLPNAWCAKATIATETTGPNGQNGVVYETVEICCDAILPAGA